jgi:hypothetical protein
LTAVKIFGFLISVLKGRTSDVVPPFESGPEATGLAAISVAHESVRRGIEPDLNSVSPGRVQTLL